jgi:hypothetical protein
MAALGRFIARSGEKALPFFKLMKRTGKFEWTPEANKAFAELKRYLTSPRIMVAPMFREPLLLYIVVTRRTASVVLVVEWDAQVIAVGDIPNGYTSDVVLIQQARVAHQGWYGGLPTGRPSCWRYHGGT